eukprot:g42313.t1
MSTAAEYIAMRAQQLLQQEAAAQRSGAPKQKGTGAISRVESESPGGAARPRLQQAGKSSVSVRVEKGKGGRQDNSKALQQERGRTDATLEGPRKKKKKKKKKTKGKEEASLQQDSTGGAASGEAQDVQPDRSTKKHQKKPQSIQAERDSVANVRSEQAAQSTPQLSSGTRRKKRKRKPSAQAAHDMACPLFPASLFANLQQTFLSPVTVPTGLQHDAAINLASAVHSHAMRSLPDLQLSRAEAARHQATAELRQYFEQQLARVVGRAVVLADRAHWQNCLTLWLHGCKLEEEIESSPVAAASGGLESALAKLSAFSANPSQATRTPTAFNPPPLPPAAGRPPPAKLVKTLVCQALPSKKAGEGADSLLIQQLCDRKAPRERAEELVTELRAKSCALLRRAFAEVCRAYSVWKKHGRLTKEQNVRAPFVLLEQGKAEKGGKVDKGAKGGKNADDDARVSCALAAERAGGGATQTAMEWMYSPPHIRSLHYRSPVFLPLHAPPEYPLDLLQAYEGFELSLRGVSVRLTSPFYAKLQGMYNYHKERERQQGQCARPNHSDPAGQTKGNKQKNRRVFPASGGGAAAPPQTTKKRRESYEPVSLTTSAAFRAEMEAGGFTATEQDEELHDRLLCCLTRYSCLYGYGSESDQTASAGTEQPAGAKSQGLSAGSSLRTQPTAVGRQGEYEEDDEEEEDREDGGDQGEKGEEYEVDVVSWAEESLPAAVFTVLRQHFGCSFECFASPFNARYPRFCSPFPDVDCPFGSVGSFLDFSPVSAGGVFQAHPPPIPVLISAMAEHMHRLLQQSDEFVARDKDKDKQAARPDTPLLFIIFARCAAPLPSPSSFSSPSSVRVSCKTWSLQRALREAWAPVHASPFLTFSMTLPAGTHCYEHSRAYTQPFRRYSAPSPATTHVFFLGNSAAQRRGLWPGPEVQAALRAAFAGPAGSDSLPWETVERSARAEQARLEQQGLCSLEWRAVPPGSEAEAASS